MNNINFIEFIGDDKHEPDITDQCDIVKQINNSNNNMNTIIDTLKKHKYKYMLIDLSKQKVNDTMIKIYANDYNQKYT